VTRAVPAPLCRQQHAVLLGVGTALQTPAHLFFFLVYYRLGYFTFGFWFPFLIPVLPAFFSLGCFFFRG
jgi:hypothetical protein